jgi:hypothetical protein
MSLPAEIEIAAFNADSPILSWSRYGLFYVLVKGITPVVVG